MEKKDLLTNTYNEH